MQVAVLRAAEQDVKPRRGMNPLAALALILVGAALGAGITAAATEASTRRSCAPYDAPPAESLVCSNLCSRSGLGPQCRTACDISLGNATRPSVLGPWIMFDDAIQHLGITVSNVSRSVEFYTSIMGGVEVQVAGNSRVQDTSLYHLLMGAALGADADTASYAANISNGGAELLDVRYVAFDQLVLEFLDYYTAEARLQRRLAAMAHVSTSDPEETSAEKASVGTASAARQLRTFPAQSSTTISPAVVHNMHIAFHVRPERNLDDFVIELETKAQAAGFQSVLCDRTVPLPRTSDGKLNVSGVPKQFNAIHQTSGNFPGWSLAYCKGPDGEQLEFNTVTGTALRWMTQAHEVYFNLTNNPKW